MYSSENLNKKLKKVKMVVIDVDGVLTDGGIYLSEKNQQITKFHVLDGTGIKMAIDSKLKIVFLTGRKTKAVLYRAKALGVNEVYQNVLNKGAVIEKIRKIHNLKKDEICYIADDLIDISALKESGVKIGVKNAHPEIRKYLDYVTKNEGGKGAVREVIDLILKSQKKWKTALAKFTSLICILFLLSCHSEKSVVYYSIIEEPDYILYEFKDRYNSGTNKIWELEAKKAEIYDEKKIIKLEKLTTTFFRENKFSSSISADFGIIDYNAKQISVLSNVIFKSDDGSILYTDTLFFDQNKDKIFTDSFVKIIKPRGDIITGYGLETDKNISKITIKKKVRGKVYENNL